MYTNTCVCVYIYLYNSNWVCACWGMLVACTQTAGFKFLLHAWDILTRPLLSMLSEEELHFSQILLDLWFMKLCMPPQTRKCLLSLWEILQQTSITSYPHCMPMILPEFSKGFFEFLPPKIDKPWILMKTNSLSHIFNGSPRPRPKPPTARTRRVRDSWRSHDVSGLEVLRDGRCLASLDRLDMNQPTR